MWRNVNTCFLLISLRYLRKMRNNRIWILLAIACVLFVAFKIDLHESLVNTHTSTLVHSYFKGKTVEDAEVAHAVVAKMHHQSSRKPKPNAKASPNNSKPVEQTTAEIPASSLPSSLILLWGSTRINEIPKSPLCGSGCEITKDRSLVDEAAAVVFQMKKMKPNDLPAPSQRKPHQVYIWFNRESSWTLKNKYKRNLTEFDHFFNWTLTYRPDSDVNSMMIPFLARPFINSFYSDDGGHSVGDFEMARESVEPKCQPSEITDADISRLVADKKKFAVWAANDCRTTVGAKKRLGIIKNLKKQKLPVDIFGKCGGKPQKLSMRNFFNLLSPYKFYFAFENSYHCKDYITEKVWFNSFYVGLVPVIWGPSRKDIERLMPQRSFVHFDDFHNATELVDYLKYLDKNETAYRDYFEWRKSSPCFYPLYNINDKAFKVENMSPYNSMTNGFCHLCKLLREGVHLKTPKSISSLAKHWYGDERIECVNDSEAERMW